MTKRPVYFKTAAEIRAILDGHKTQMRRRIIPQPTGEFLSFLERPIRKESDLPVLRAWFQAGKDERSSFEVTCPYGKPGDQLWVREKWQAIHVSIDPETGWGDDMDVAEVIPKTNPSGYWNAVCAATDRQAHESKEDRGFSWRPSIHMPRWASRITLEITGVRVERLQDISEADARAEGIGELSLQEGQLGAWWAADPTRPELHSRSAVSAYSRLWDSIHGPGSWHANHLVWVVEFQKVEK